MSNKNLIARRLPGTALVQYGQGGSDEPFERMCWNLITLYKTPKDVDYLFSLGQVSHVGIPNQHNIKFESNHQNRPIGKAHLIAASERSIFDLTKTAGPSFIYENNGEWYCIIPGPFKIKIKAAFMHELYAYWDTRLMADDVFPSINRMLISYILEQYYASNTEFQKVVEKVKVKRIEDIREDILNDENPEIALYEKFPNIFNYFDDWVLAMPNEEGDDISHFILRKRDEENRKETYEWEEDYSDILDIKSEGISFYLQSRDPLINLAIKAQCLAAQRKTEQRLR